MEKPPVTKKGLFIITLLSLLMVLIIFLFSLFDNHSKLVFCDVGQGDAAYIRVKNKIDILIDAGPNNKILSCLGKHMPFYDKTIEFVILTHPQKDHYGGLFYILDRYNIKMILTSSINSPALSFKQLMKKINDKKVFVRKSTASAIINLSGSRLVFLWPPEEKKYSSLSTHDLNSLSIVFFYEESGFRVLFTGDATPGVLRRLSEKQKVKSDILKIPHHGSKNGLTLQFLKLADPMVSVISVGKKNSYGHPSKEVLDMFKALNKRYLRTDIDGDIVFKIGI